jgi:hypothetical protein
LTVAFLKNNQNRLEAEIDLMILARQNEMMRYSTRGLTSATAISAAHFMRD